MNLNFQTFPQLETQRLTLRRLQLSDAEEIHQLRSNAEANKYINRPLSTGIADAEVYIKKISELLKNSESMYWAISLKGKNQLIGTICLWNGDLQQKTIELGYELLQTYHGKGLMTEAVNAVLDFGFNHILARKIIAFTAAGNEKSISVLKRFNFEPADDEITYAHGDADDMSVYTLKAENFTPNPVR